EGKIKPVTVNGQCVAAGITAPLAPENLEDIAMVSGINEGTDVYGFHGGFTVMIGDITRKVHWDFAATKP
ncbi:MAG TPA: hypothetical protein VLT89_16830, partial [Usitatibacter sp.]|nr:hypothetical protein [Usitatibacter sp.]